MKLFLSARKHEPVVAKVPPAMRRAAAYLDRSKPGELFTTRQLAVAVGISIDSLGGYGYTIPRYWHRVRASLKYWGKPATIDELRKELKKR